MHQGMTSSDVLDTCLNVQLVHASDLIINDINKLLAALKRRAFEHKMTIRIGRSHGIHAEPTTMGLTFARFYAEMDRNLKRMKAAKEEISTGALSGAVGTFANLDPAVEEYVCEKLNLIPETISTQIKFHSFHFELVVVLFAKPIEIELMFNQIVTNHNQNETKTK